MFCERFPNLDCIAMALPNWTGEGPRAGRPGPQAAGCPRPRHHPPSWEGPAETQGLRGPSDSRSARFAFPIHVPVPVQAVLRAENHRPDPLTAGLTTNPPDESLLPTGSKRHLRVIVSQRDDFRSPSAHREGYLLKWGLWRPLGFESSRLIIIRKQPPTTHSSPRDGDKGATSQ